MWKRILPDLTTDVAPDFIPASQSLVRVPAPAQQAGVVLWFQMHRPVPVSHSPVTGSRDLTKTAQTAIVDIANKAKDKRQRSHRLPPTQLIRIALCSR
jgi:hypothetical protein